MREEWTWWVLSALVTLGGCATPGQPAGSPVEQVWEAPAPSMAPAPIEEPATARQSQPEGPAEATAPTDAPAGARTPAIPDPIASPPIALVNGQPISRAELTDMLIASHGIGVLDQLILLTAARQRAAEMGLTVTARDEAAAHEDALRRIATPIGNPDAQPLDRAAAERLLTEFLEVKNLSKVEWDCRMKQRACLRKIAEAEVARMEITDQMLRDEYGLAYGEKVQIRHIQVSTAEAARRARALLNEGQDFAAVARELSENAITAREGGLMPPFSRHDGAVPPFIREMAFSMQPGQVSEPLRDGTWYHVIRVERTFPASSVGFEHVDQKALRERLVRRLVAQRTESLEAELFQSARIDVRDPELARQFRLRHRADRSNE